jgi:predicted protein tyrosine phosphatase
MPFWLVYMETFGADFLTPSFVICISKHHHHHQVFKRVDEWLGGRRAEAQEVPPRYVYKVFVLIRIAEFLEKFNVLIRPFG